MSQPTATINASGFCSASGKVAFKNEAAARKHERSLDVRTKDRRKKDKRRPAGEMRIYRCDFCHAYHLGHFQKKF